MHKFIRKDIKLVRVADGIYAPDPAQRADRLVKARRRIGRRSTPEGRDELRSQLLGDLLFLFEEIDPQYHPTLSRRAIHQAFSGCPLDWGDCPSEWGDELNRAVSAMELALRGAMGAALRPEPAWADFFSREAIALWRERAEAPRAPVPEFDPHSRGTAPGWMFLNSRGTIHMLLATGAPVVFAASRDSTRRYALIPQDYADRCLQFCDARECSDQGQGLGLLACLGNAMTASFCVLRALADDAPGLMGPLRGFMAAIANSGRVALDEDDRFVSTIDFVSLLIACDWVEEEIDANIARNIRQLVGWMKGHEAFRLETIRRATAPGP